MRPGAPPGTNNRMVTTIALSPSPSLIPNGKFCEHPNENGQTDDVVSGPSSIPGFDPEPAVLPWPVRVRRRFPNLFGIAWKVDRRLRYRGRRFACPVCGSELRRWKFGYGTWDKRCPICHSFSRDRMLWLWLKRETDFFSRAQRLLHFAPEPSLHQKLRQLANLEYLSADFVSPHVDIMCDAQALPFHDDSMDVIFCNHVLQYVRDDIRAMGELRRVLKADGWVIVLVPYQADSTTDEDFGELTHEQRFDRFGPGDPWRRYGADMTDRLDRCGLTLDVEFYALRLGADSDRFGLRADEALLVARPAT